MPQAGQSRIRYAIVVCTLPAHTHRPTVFSALTGRMHILTARPENMFGNVALASVVAGVPVGLLFAVIGLATHPIAALDTWKASLGSVLLAPVFVLIAGLVLLPILYALRRLGYAGPLVVWTLSGLFSLVLMSSDVRAGLLALVLAVPATYVFCRYAYDFVVNKGF